MEMRQRNLRFTPYDDARLIERADAANLSVPELCRSIVLRELNAIDAAAVLREEFDHAFKQLRQDAHTQRLEQFDQLTALRDSLTTSFDRLLVEITKAIPAPAKTTTGRGPSGNTF